MYDNFRGHGFGSTSREFPSHWRDSKHEPDGAARDTLALEEGREPFAEEWLRFFQIGGNDGERLLKHEMNLLMTKYDGSEESWDDVTGAQLVVGLVRAARKLEMKFF